MSYTSPARGPPLHGPPKFPFERIREGYEQGKKAIASLMILVFIPVQRCVDFREAA